jgi:putative hydrolase of HD superfamily
MDRLEKQLQFIVEIDKLKSIYRRTYLIDGARNENTAEHSWHLAMLAMVLAEYANEPISIERVVKMALVHDIVELDAGDTYIYDAQGALDKAERERAAADRIFALLPVDQGEEFRSLWEEFDSGATADARFASALDRFIPQLHNFHTRGRSWKEHEITADRVLARNVTISDGSQILWEWTQTLIARAVAEGLLKEK